MQDNNHLLPPKSMRPEADVERDMRGLKRKVNYSLAAIFAERAWPRVAPPLATMAIFAAAAWSGLINAVPHETRPVAWLACALAAAASTRLFKAGSLRVTRDEALRRIDSRTDAPQARPATTLLEPNPGLREGADPVTAALWEANQKNLRQKYLGTFTVGMPVSQIPDRLPRAMRYAPLSLMAASVVFAGQAGLHNLAESFNFTAPPPPIEARMWVTAPAGFTDAPGLVADNATSPMPTHRDSVMTLVVKNRDFPVTINGERLTPVRVADRRNPKAFDYHYKVTLAQGDQVVSIDGRKQWTLAVLPDNPPQMAITGIDADPAKPGALRAQVAGWDDYKITEAWLEVIEPNDPEDPPLPSFKLPQVPVNVTADPREPLAQASPVRAGP